MEEEISKRNESIANFMGYENVTVGYYGEDDETEWQRQNEEWMDKVGMEDIGNYWVNIKENRFYEVEELQYHSSWDWLMPVVQKIEASGFEIDICQNKCLIMNDVKNIPEPITKENLPYEKRYEGQSSGETKIEAVFNCVSDYCINQNKEK
jgi:ABC-type Fe3+/spermidine/putrescine transport system ATPase subunit